MQTVFQGVVFIAVGLLLTLLAIVITRHLVPPRALLPRNAVTGDVYTAATTAYAVVLAFAVITAWGQYRDAQTGTDAEAGALAVLLHLAASAPASVRQPARTAVLNYAHLVVTDEWPALGREQAPTSRTTSALDRLWRIETVDAPAAGANGALVSEAVDQLTTIEIQRQRRIMMSQAGLPGLMWVALGGGGLLVLVFTCFFGVESAGAQVAIVGLLVAIIIALLFVVYALDHPYRGALRVRPTAFELLLRETSAGQPPTAHASSAPVGSGALATIRDPTSAFFAYGSGATVDGAMDNQQPAGRSRDAARIVAHISSAQRVSGIGWQAKPSVCAIRSGLLIPTIVVVMRGSRSENWSAAEGSGTPARSQISLIRRTRSIRWAEAV